eukprot:gb/GECH01003244.1/.p1 GENE.gb/GECH01003244.1/~~gb/GECH01003244.1/.p1  ORF type:complete len:467 (+),score=101.00 gb/GECH01003244.1/:1-1401(+)
MVIVADDCSLRRDAGAGRRGVAGTVFLHKILGAAAEDKRSLDDMAAIGERITHHVISMGVALGSNIIPEASQPTFHLEDNRMVLGIGIHGEPGVQETAREPADRIVDALLRHIVPESSLSSALKTDDGYRRVVLLVNNLGSTTAMELYIAARRAIDYLQHEASIAVDRVYVGNFMTSLEMAGLTLSLLCVYDEDLLNMLDQECCAPGWSPQASFSRIDQATALRQRSSIPPTPAPQSTTSELENRNETETDINVPFVKRVIKTLAHVAIENEPHLTQLDQRCGDGDLGFTLAKLGRLIIERVCHNNELNNGHSVLYESGMVAREIGGTSGVLYSVFILKIASMIRKSSENGSARNDTQLWATALQEGVAAISDTGGAQVGDCTMIDALQPACNAFAEHISRGEDITTTLKAAVQAAKEGAASTRSLIPQKGRGSYIGEQARDIPDPGAEIIPLYWEGMLALFKEQN